jgi:hypothetical protein
MCDCIYNFIFSPFGFEKKIKSGSCDPGLTYRTTARGKREKCGIMFSEIKISASIGTNCPRDSGQPGFCAPGHFLRKSVAKKIQHLSAFFFEVYFYNR